MSGPVEAIAILGDGLEAWLVATRIRSAFPDEAVRITVLSQAGHGDEDAAYTLVSPRGLETLGACGVSVADLLALPSSVPQLGVIYRQTGQDQPRPWGGCGIDWAGTGFHHHWLRARKGGLPHPFFAFSPGYHAMAGNRFAPPDPRNAIGPLQHETGLNIAPSELAGLLRERLASSVIMDDAQAGPNDPDADLVINASGGDQAATAIIEPSQLETQSGSPIFDRESTRSTWLIPRRNGHVRITAPPTTHRNSAPWSGQHLAIGLAAGLPDHAQEWALPFLGLCLDRLVGLLPDSEMRDIETSEYNRLWTQEWDELDAISALLGGRAHDHTQARQDAFAKRGFVAPIESDLLEPIDWIHHFLVLGIIPEQYDWLSERLDDPRLKQELQGLAACIMQVAREFPDHRAYIAALDRARQGAREVAG